MVEMDDEKLDQQIYARVMCMDCSEDFAIHADLKWTAYYRHGECAYCSWTGNLESVKPNCDQDILCPECSRPDSLIRKYPQSTDIDFETPL